MKKLLVLLCIVFIAAPSWTQTTEYLQHKDFQTEKKKIYDGINASKKQLNELRKADTKLLQSIDSLKRTISDQAGQLSLAADSLSKTSLKLNALEQNVSNQDIPSRSARILVFVILLILFAVLFILVFLFKKRAELNHQSLVDLDKKTNERLNSELASIISEIQRTWDVINDAARETDLRIKTAVDTFETKTGQLEQKWQEKISNSERTVESLRPEIGKLKEEQSNILKTLEDKLHALKGEMVKVNQGFAAQAAKLEEELTLLKGKK